MIAPPLALAASADGPLESAANVCGDSFGCESTGDGGLTTVTLTVVAALVP
jgi:hypothetical protein